MQVEKTVVTVRLTVEADISVYAPEDFHLPDLIGEVVAVKSGTYENQSYGNITSAEILSSRVETEDWDESDNTEGSLDAPSE